MIFDTVKDASMYAQKELYPLGESSFLLVATGMEVKGNLRNGPFAYVRELVKPDWLILTPEEILTSREREPI